MKYLLYLLAELTAAYTFASTNGFSEVNLRVHDLAYDPPTQKLYATSPDHTNDLLQVDPATGAITATFPVENMPRRLVLDTRRGLWIGLKSEGMVQRFNLDTLTVDLKFDLRIGAAFVFDIAPSPNDADTFAVNAGGRTYLIRDGVVLPDSIEGTGHLVMLGDFVFGPLRMRVTPTGLVVDGGGVDPGATEVADNRIYYEVGSVDPFSVGSNIYYYPPLGNTDPFLPATFVYAFDVNPENNSFLQLSQFPQKFHLTRYDRRTGEITGYTAFNMPTPINRIFKLEAIGTNRVAFAITDEPIFDPPSPSGEKLFLLDLAALFAPGDLEVSMEAAPNPAALGHFVTETITLANKGPGYVLNAFLTNHLSENARFLEAPPGAVLDSQVPFWMAWDVSAFHWHFDTIAPGETRIVQSRITPIAPGSFTNFISVRSHLETNLQNNNLDFAVPVLNTLTNARTRLAPSTNVTALAFDPTDDELLIGDVHGNLFRLSLGEGELQSPYSQTVAGFGKSVEQISLSAETRTAWVAVSGWDSLYRVPLDEGSVSGEIRINSFLRDVEASPIDLQVAAYSGDSDVRLYGPNYFHPNNSQAGSGLVEFSADGKKLYQIMDLDCSLRVLNVTATNVTVERTFPNIGCYEFAESSGLLYLYNGAVIDPLNGITITNLNLPFPSFIVPDPAGPLNVLTRTNNVWVVRRLDRNTFGEIDRIHLGSEVSTSAISAGTNRIAFVDANHEAQLVRFEPDASTVRVSITRSGDNLILQFATQSGARYRLEQSPSIVSPIWTPVGQQITGTGLLTEQTVLASDRGNFYRLARLP